jgi:dimethylargininase
MLIALTRPVSASINRCELTHLDRTPIDLPKAIVQHEYYEQCLRDLGCHVQRLPAMPESPDAVFVEDTCVVFDEMAVITRPGAKSRQEETESVADAIKAYRELRWIETPGTLDGGDVLCLGRQVFVGRSTRTNADGIEQLRRLLASRGYAVNAVELGGALHLKSAVTVAAESTILANSAWVDPRVFGDVSVIMTDPSEPAAANALRIGDDVVYPINFLKTQERLRNCGIKMLTVDMSELAKAEGGVTCCSLILETNRK